MDSATFRLQGPEEHRPRSPFDTAYDKGAIAAAAGDSEADCPYSDHRTGQNRTTWSRAWRRAWLKGFRGVVEGVIEVNVERATPPQQEVEDENG